MQGVDAIGGDTPKGVVFKVNNMQFTTTDKFVIAIAVTSAVLALVHAMPNFSAMVLTMVV